MQTQIFNTLPEAETFCTENPQFPNQWIVQGKTKFYVEFVEPKLTHPFERIRGIYLFGKKYTKKVKEVPEQFKLFPPLTSNQ